jgi:hypothetical protein
MELLSFGDSLTCGQYQLHSQFDAVVNFHLTTGQESHLVSLATAKVGAGPSTIVVDQLPADMVWSGVEVRSGHIRVKSQNQEVIFFKDDNSLYHSKVVWPINSSSADQLVRQRVAMIRQWSRQQSDHFGLMLLLNPDYSYSCNRFEQACLEHVAEALPLLFSDQWERGAKKLRGVGPGLTPAGDDFLLGVATAALITGRVKNSKRLEERSRAIANIVQSDNLIVKEFANMVATGSFSAPVKGLIESLVNHQVSEAKFRNSFEQVISLGHSSGGDLLTGLVLGIERSEVWR